MTSELENAIINDYLNKLKITEIIKKYHVSSATVSALLKKNNIASRYQTEKRTNINKCIFSEFMCSQSAESIALKYNLSEKEVKAIFRKERDKRIIRAYKSDISIDNICIKYKLSNMAVYKILNKYNIPRKITRAKPKTYSQISAAAESGIVQDYLQKEISIAEILKKHQISKHQLYTLVYKNQLEPRGITSLSNKQKEEIVEKYKSGETCTNLGREYHVSRNIISYIVRMKENE